MIGRHRIGRLGRHLAESLQLVLEHTKNELGILRRVIQMSRLQSPIEVMFHKMMIGVARKRQRVKPERIDRRVNDPPEVWPDSCQMRQIMVQYIVADTVIALRQAGFHLVQRSRQSALSCPDRRAIAIADGGESKDLGGLGIDLDVERHAAAEKLDCRPSQGRCNVQSEPLTASDWHRAFTIASRYTPCFAGNNTDLPVLSLSSRDFRLPCNVIRLSNSGLDTWTPVITSRFETAAVIHSVHCKESIDAATQPVFAGGAPRPAEQGRRSARGFGGHGGFRAFPAATDPRPRV
ncbi:hypothetical protein [Croceicoccus marinus]|uniref:hypothetical protein n=1 Tax=Croceicoccus marinus TaxID=450378 RepID=UPI001FD104AD|nr:hypothetical protein [Croceicoccus marinus]